MPSLIRHIRMNQHARLDPHRSRSSTSPRSAAGSAPRSTTRSRASLAHCQFIIGPEVAALENELAAFCGARHAVGCASGTDALMLVLMAKGIGPGDAVICPAFTFCATAEVVALLGATPVFADVDAATFNLDPAELPSARSRPPRRRASSRRRSIPVDLFGLPADHDAIAPIAEARRSVRPRRRRAGLRRDLQGPQLGTLAPATATSFFPAKPLGCYGDGGAIFTDDDALAERDAQPARARAGHRQIRQCAHRHDRPARHHPGRGADREAEDFPRRDRRARPHRAALQRRSGRCRARAAGARRLDLGLGAIHHPPRRRAGATRLPRRSRRRAFRPRSIIPCRCIGRTPTGTFRWPMAASR